jgi:hypothetical protein
MRRKKGGKMLCPVNKASRCLGVGARASGLVAYEYVDPFGKHTKLVVMGQSGGRQGGCVRGWGSV